MTITDEKQKYTPVERRTQQERTASTKRALLDATVKCIALKGYSSTSISLILKEVEVSRGALLHHFPSKIELVAAAMNDFYINLGDEVDKRLHDIEPENDSFKKRLDIVNEVFGKNPSARIEFMVAARTDPDLANAIKSQQNYDSSNFFPQLTNLAEEEPLKMLISAFLLGNSLMAAWEPGSTDPAYDIFVEMIDQFINQQAGRS